jgi:hypothetical protein
MKRAVLTAVLVAAAVPAAAQNFGSPLWNSPKGGTGITISGDYAKPNADMGKGSAFGGRATLGLANLSVTAAYTSWKPEGAPESFSSIGGNAAFRVIGGSLLPIALNIQVGAARQGAANGDSALTRLTAGVGIAASIPTPGISIEPYLSVSNRWYKSDAFSTQSNIGFVLGANLNLGMFGFHVAYDSEKFDSGAKGGIIGIGAHVALKAPIGM